MLLSTDRATYGEPQCLARYVGAYSLSTPPLRGHQNAEEAFEHCVGAVRGMHLSERAGCKLSAEAGPATAVRSSKITAGRMSGWNYERVLAGICSA